MPNSSKAPTPTPKEQNWFNRMSLRTQALLLGLLFFVVSAGTFLLGIYEWHSDHSVANMVGRSDWTDDFFWSAATFVLAAALVAVGMGWIKFAKPEDSPK